MGRKKERSKRQIIEPLGRLQRKDVGTELKVTYRTEKQLLDNQRHKCNRTREGCAAGEEQEIHVLKCCITVGKHSQNGQ